ncbi:MAG: TetR/AcrR family transcriptional regulator [Leptonema sp. (in: Bacteria)]|nr:TetR/AcrR family transcriptional regulator [Leptonema sp. (in: bacteria)]
MQKLVVESSKKAAIEQAALDLFTKQGFGSTSVPSIAERAGVGSGTIYRYFESKEELVNRLFQYWQNKLYLELTEAYDNNATTRQKYNHIWQQLTHFQKLHPTAFDFLEMMYYTPHLDRESKSYRVKLLKFLTQILNEDREIFHPFSSDELIAIVWGAFVGLVRASTTRRVKLSDELLLQSREAIWRAIALNI